jgi:hypothetical protein
LVRTENHHNRDRHIFIHQLRRLRYRLGDATATVIRRGRKVSNDERAVTRGLRVRRLLVERTLPAPSH